MATQNARDEQRLRRIQRFVESAEDTAKEAATLLKRYGSNVEHIARSGRAETLGRVLREVEKYARLARTQLREAEKDYR